VGAGGGGSGGGGGGWRGRGGGGAVDKSDVPLERWLFHGCGHGVVPLILQGGFDWRLSGSATGTLWGKGTYFATCPRYSHDYARPATAADSASAASAAAAAGGGGSLRRPDSPWGRHYPVAAGERTLVLARVLVGRHTRGRGDMVRPPEGSDSACDGASPPGIFVSFHMSQAYPAYVVTYL
jgi:hypothetical protein